MSDKEKEVKMLNHKDVIKHLDAYVVGQDEAKKVLAYALVMHNLKELAAYKTGREVPYKKSTVMIVGSTGVGKTYLLEKLASVGGRSVHVINAKDITSEGYVGMSLHDALANFAQTDEDIESSIIFIDEFDKLCEQASHSADSFNIPVQQQMLKFIEGQEVSVKSGALGKTKRVDTANILFVLGGNFQGMRDKRKHTGSMSLANTAKKEVTLHKELQENGVIRELAGRISVVAELHDLTEEHMHAIVNVKDNVVAQAKEVLELYGIKHKFTPKRIEKLISVCLENNTGARGLQTEVDKHLLDVISDAEVSIVPEDFGLREITEDGVAIGEETEAGKDLMTIQFNPENAATDIKDLFENIGKCKFKIGGQYITNGGAVVIIDHIDLKFQVVEGVLRTSPFTGTVWDLEGNCVDKDLTDKERDSYKILREVPLL